MFAPLVVDVIITTCLKNLLFFFFFFVELSSKIVVTIWKCLRMRAFNDKCLILFSYTSPNKKCVNFNISCRLPFSSWDARFNSIKNHFVPLKGLGGFANKSEDDVLHDCKTTLIVTTSVSNFKGNDWEPLTSMFFFKKKNKKKTLWAHRWF
jgi:hypothetical protein